MIIVLPERFTYPFCYVPHPLVREAAQSLIERLDRGESLDGEALESLSAGKMLGALIALDEAGNTVTLYAFSGLVGGRSVLPGFVEPIFDWAAPSGFFRVREAEISAMEDGVLKSRASAELQDWLFEQYKVLNARGEELTIKEVFARAGLVPPGGTGECAAPKLLQGAYRAGLKPLAMGEFWYGAASSSEVRQKGRFYPSCTGKCGPLLSFMMEGLDVDANPLDRDYFPEPAVLYSDESIIVVNKPAGALSVPGRVPSPSMIDWLSARYGNVFSCHRLDMDTSGVMVYARTAEAKSCLEAQFAAGTVEKCYRARLVAGAFRHARKGTIALPLMLDYYDRPRQIVDFEHGKKSVTDYEVLEVLPSGEREVRFIPHTGRSHQIRVHSAHSLGLGLTIRGDRLYGDPREGGEADGFEKLYLRAESISFDHPASGERMNFRI